MAENMYCSEQKANDLDFRDNYDAVKWYKIVCQDCGMVIHTLLRGYRCARCFRARDMIQEDAQKRSG